ncbi:MAG: hypothetical protein WBF56_05450, partial [Candidatus Acidiferrales bacterium]
MDSSKRRRISRIVGIGMGAVILCPILVHFGRVWIPKMWGDLRFVNYFVAFIPTILSILFAFVIDKELERRMKMLWRVGIVLCGFLYSAALWHQQSLTDKSDIATQTAIVNDAVSRANKHSDESFAGVQKNVGDLGEEVKGVNKQQVQLAQDFSKATGDIDANLGKVGRPDPPIPAKLVLSLWTDSATAENPVLSETVQPDAGGNFPVDFSFANASESVAESIDFWIQLCDQCAFAAEPEGFEKTAGSSEKVRH